MKNPTELIFGQEERDSLSMNSFKAKRHRLILYPLNAKLPNAPISSTLP
jgi:hypothetical protein